MKKRKFKIRDRIIVIDSNTKGLIVGYYEESGYWRYDIKHLFGEFKRNIVNYPEWELKKYKKKN